MRVAKVVGGLPWDEVSLCSHRTWDVDVRQMEGDVKDKRIACYEVESISILGL